MKAPLLEVKNLSATYVDQRGSLHVLDRLSFNIKSGEFVCVLGPSGSGKSTLLRILAGLLPIRAGAVTLNGKTVRGPQPGVSLVFQDPTLMPWRTVEENVGLPLKLGNPSNGAAQAQIQAMITLVGLNGFETALPRDLSGGMAQRAALGRALVQDPEMMLMDEPFGSLDAITRERMGEELLHIWEGDHKTVLLVTHNINEAVYLADRVLVLSARPAQIRLDLQIRLPRPRPSAVRYTPEFGKLAARLRAAIE